jgi:nucleoside-diphosphate-sugar epimerase
VHVDDVARAIAAALVGGPTHDPIFVGSPGAGDGSGPSCRRAGRRGPFGQRSCAFRCRHGIAGAGGELRGAVIGRPMPLNWSRYLELSAEGFVCRVDRLRERLGVVAYVGLRRGLIETAGWYRSRGWL